MKRNYIGLATSIHDGAIAIVNSKGEIVFAEATERYLQNKRAFNMAPDQLFYISKLIKTYIEPGAELVVAHTWSDTRIGKLVKLLEELNKIEFEKLPFFWRRIVAGVKYSLESHIYALQQASKTLTYTINQMEEYKESGNFLVKKYDHHLTHAATACFTSPFHEACCVVVDGYGEGSAFNCYRYHDGKIEQLPGVKDGDGSLGSFYSAVCDTCGFEELLGEEWKVMGLAAYGKFDQQIYDLLKSYIKVDGLSLKDCSPDWKASLFEKLYSMRRKPWEPAIVAADIAYNGQLVYTELLYEFLRNVCQLNISDNLVMSGGCCLNSAANGTITEKTGFKNLYVFSAPADDGNAIGAALLAYYEDHPDERRTPGFQSPYLGSELSQYKIEHLKRFGNFKKIKRYPDDIHYQAAKLLADGKIIGWVQGKAEFGPRALGNRSILADPRSPAIKDIINERVKFREEFRPLAPSILHEFGPEYFENYQETPYMERALRFKEEVKHKVPGVVHEDGTGRLQTVKKEWNERYYNLIKAFYELTGIPLVLNTSYNVMGKPIIHSVEDAIAVFCTSGLDAVVLGDLLIEKEE
jgi:carbamoyltransferase